MTSVVRFKMDSNDKEILEVMLKDMGLDLDTAFRMFAYKVLKAARFPLALAAALTRIRFGHKKMKKLTKKH